MNKEITFPFNLTGRKAIYFVQQIQDTLKNAIYLGKDERQVNAKSLLGVLSLGIKEGDKFNLFYEDEADFKVMEEIIKLIQEEF